MKTKTLEELLQDIATQKAKLDSFRPLPKELIINLNDWFRIELTYSSNALEGNTLTSSETALIVEKGLTIGGKTLKEHLEAVNHAEAFDYVLELARSSKVDIALRDVFDIHRLILRRIDDDNGGKLRRIGVRISNSDFKFPESFRLPELMDDFIQWLHATQDHPVIIAADAHLKLVTIHPFIDGNGRTARLLMNLLLLQQGYPPASIVPPERNTYIDSLVQAQKFNDAIPYYEIIINAVKRSLDIYIEQAQQTI
jgi:Fic family protein